MNHARWLLLARVGWMITTMFITGTFLFTAHRNALVRGGVSGNHPYWGGLTQMEQLAAAV